jgi:hypothetical protein
MSIQTPCSRSIYTNPDRIRRGNTRQIAEGSGSPLAASGSVAERFTRETKESRY